jgi:hypothetical protein
MDKVATGTASRQEFYTALKRNKMQYWRFLMKSSPKIILLDHTGTQLCYATPWSRALSERLIVAHLVKKFPTFHETQRFITTFTRACQVQGLM